MALFIDQIRANLYQACHCRNYIDVTIYPTTAYTTAQVIYLPPLLGTPGAPLQFRCSSITDVSYVYAYTGTTTYNIGKYTSWQSVTTALYNKYFVPYVGMIAGATTNTRIVFRPVFLNSLVTDGASSAVYRMPGVASSATPNLANLFPSFPPVDNGGVSSGEYNALVDAAIKCSKMPVLQAGCSSIGSTQSYTSTWPGWTFPICIDPNGPWIQMVLTLILYTSDTAVTSFRVSFGHGAWTGTAARSWRTGSFSEYRIDLSAMVNTVDPDYSACGRDFWYCHVDLFPSVKGSGSIYSWSAWTGVPEGPLA